MSVNHNDVVKGFNIPSQIPLDKKTTVSQESDLVNLGSGNQKAFTYYDGLVIYCNLEKTFWVWKEEQNIDSRPKKLTTGFTYPNNVIINGVDYSNKTYNFYKLITDFELLPTGIGYNFLKGSENLTHQKRFAFYSFDTTTLNIKLIDDVYQINLPSTASIDAVNVNSAYLPTYEEWFRYKGVDNYYRGDGSISRPFTNSIIYTSETEYTVVANSSINNALTAYIGTGTPLNPISEYVNQEIIIENNPNEAYFFDGTFNINNIKVKINGSLVHTASSLLVNMDDSSKFNPINSLVVITVNGVLQSTFGNIFQNSGNNISTNTFATGRQLNLLGDGQVYSSNEDPSKSIFTCNSPNNNDGNLCFYVDCDVRAINHKVYTVGGRCKIDFYKKVISGEITNTVDVNLKAFHHLGGQVRFFETSLISLGGNSLSTRNYGFFFEPQVGFTATLLLIGPSIDGSAVNLFYKENNNNVNINCSNLKGVEFFSTNVFNKALGVPVFNVLFRNNYLAGGSLNQETVVDLTNGNNTTSLNTIGLDVIETLTKHNTRTAANSYFNKSGVPFLNTNNNNISKSTWFRDITIL